LPYTPWAVSGKLNFHTSMRQFTRARDPTERSSPAHQLISLPTKLGGLGVLSMLECAHHAYAAASEA
jgi:hypothetical protein